jgi:Na+-driven multidrug efflux pump
VEGIWYALIGDWIVRMSMYIWRLFSDRWAVHRVIG